MIPLPPRSTLFPYTMLFRSGTDGALEAVAAAQRAGKIRYVGFTGHKSPAIHLRMLDTARANGFTFDAVQMPLDRKSTRLNSSHRCISYAVFCLKKKKQEKTT